MKDIVREMLITQLQEILSTRSLTEVADQREAAWVHLRQTRANDDDSAETAAITETAEAVHDAAFAEYSEKVEEIFCAVDTINTACALRADFVASGLMETLSSFLLEADVYTLKGRAAKR